MNGLEQISQKEYLGRLMFLGRNVVLYAITGRSSQSRARKFTQDKDGTIRTEPTDPKELEKGNPALLLYPCVKRVNDILVVSNGAQTNLIADTVERTSRNIEGNPVDVLVEAFSKPCIVDDGKGNLIDLIMYEPDAPNWTPRISGILTRDKAALVIVKYDEGMPAKQFFEFPLRQGCGRVLATYSGKNVPKGVRIPSFEGEPFEARLFGETPEQLAKGLYEALGPKQPGPEIISPGDDFRVGVACVYFKTSPRPEIKTHITNRCEQK